MARVDGEIKYAVQMKITKNRMDMVPAAELKPYGSKKLIAFLENAIEFVMPTQRGNNEKFVLSKNDVGGMPIEILGLTDIDGVLKYLCKWRNHHKVVTSRDASEKFPQMIIAYLEAQIDFSSPPVSEISWTRGKVNSFSKITQNLIV